MDVRNENKWEKNSVVKKEYWSIYVNKSLLIIITWNQSYQKKSCAKSDKDK